MMYYILNGWRSRFSNLARRVGRAGFFGSSFASLPCFDLPTNLVIKHTNLSYLIGYSRINGLFLAKHRFRKSLALGLSLSLSLALAAPLTLFSSTAFADIRKTDIILGESIEARNLSASDVPNIKADYACVVSQDGRMLYERETNAQSQIASMTKIMTAYVALKHSKPDEIVQIDSKSSSIGESTSNLKAGDSLSMHDALLGLMVASGNDAAFAIAEHVGNQLKNSSKPNQTDASQMSAYDIFIKEMNTTAAELGMKDSIFTNPHGLDDGKWEGNQHSTASDMAKLVVAAMKIPEFRELVNNHEVVLKVNRQGQMVDIKLKSTDILIGTYEGANGIKTGFTEKAGACFAGSNNRGEGDIYSIVMHSPTEITRFDDTRILFDWYYDHHISYPYAHTGQTVSVPVDDQGKLFKAGFKPFDKQEAFGSAEFPLVAEVASLGWIDKLIPATIADPQAAVACFNLNGNVSQEVVLDEVHGSVSVGDKIGTITLKQRNQVLGTVDIVAAQDVAAPTIWESIGIFWERFMHNFNGGQTVAESKVFNTTPLINDKSKSSAQRSS